MHELFRHFAARVAHGVGHAYTFIAAFLLIVLWGATGPLFGFSDTWQLVINTTTTIVTFLMVFLIQNTQNRDAKAIHLKLDELIMAIGPARNAMIDLEELDDEKLEALEGEYRKIRDEAATELQRRSRSRS